MKKRLFLLPVFGTFFLAGCTVNLLGNEIKIDLPWESKTEENQEKKEEEKEKEQEQEQHGSGLYEYEPTIEGGTEEEKTAILKTLNSKPICNQVGKSNTELYPESNPILMEDNGDSIKLTTKQVIGELTVNLEWDVDETQTYFGALLDSDEAHKVIEVAYQGFGAAEGELKWSIGKISCGDAVSIKPSMMTYKAKCKNEEFKHDNYTIAQLYDFVDEVKTVKVGSTEYKFPSTFNIVDYEDEGDSSYSPYFITNNPQAESTKQYLYVNVTGKVLYLAPDGNWGLLGDGENVLEFYAGSGSALNSKNWPNLGVGKYVTLVGNMGQYCGNVQLGFLTRIKEAKASDITEPTGDFHELNEEKLGLLRKEGFSADTQALMVDGIHMDGSLRQVTGTLVPGSLKDKDKESVSNPENLVNNRFTFDLKVGEKTLTVAYDYHTDREAKVGFFNDLKAKLAVGGEMTIKGTMRYSGNNSTPFNQAEGVWNIVPFELGHVA